MMTLKLQTQMDRSPPNRVVVAGAFESDEIEELGERLVVLTADQAKDLERYLKSRIGSDGEDGADQPEGPDRRSQGHPLRS